MLTAESTARSQKGYKISIIKPNRPKVGRLSSDAGLPFFVGRFHALFKLLNVLSIK